MKLSLRKDLTPLREQAIVEVDAAAGAVRARFITTAPGQEMTYLEKRREAEDLMAGRALEGELPHLAAESAVNGITPFDQAVEYLTMAHVWGIVSAQIESARIGAKVAIAAAQTPAEIRAAIPDWSSIAQ